MPYQASYPIFKLVYSAAKNANHNMGLNEADLFISKAEVNRSTIRKKTTIIHILYNFTLF
jgi:large subunit ribosomal protein L22